MTATASEPLGFRLRSVLAAFDVIEEQVATEPITVANAPQLLELFAAISYDLCHLRIAAYERGGFEAEYMLLVDEEQLHRLDKHIWRLAGLPGAPEREMLLDESPAVQSWDLLMCLFVDPDLSLGTLRGSVIRAHDQFLAGLAEAGGPQTSTIEGAP